LLKKLTQNSLFQDTGIYTITSIINAGIPFLLLPILTRYLSPEDYGLISMFALLVSFVSPFIGISINGAISRQYFNREDLNIWEYVFNCLLILAINSIITFLIFVNFSRLITKVTSFPEQSLWMVIVFAFSQIVINVLLSLWQVQKKALYYGMFNNFKTLINLGLSILLVVIFGFGWKGRIYGQLWAVIIFSIIALAIIIKNGWIKVSFKKRYVYHALLFGVPLIPHALSGTIISMTDRIFITNMVGLAATGVYTVGYQIGSVIDLITSSFNNAYVPWLFERLKRNNHETNKKIVTFTYGYFIGIIILALILGIVAPPLLKVFLGKSFNDSSAYVIWIAAGYAFNGMYLMVVNYIFYSQKNSLLAMVTFLTALINIVLNYFFVRNFGAIGAAQATTLVFFTKFIMVWILSAKVHKMPWKDVLLRRD